jgi:hypothetical protein
MNPGHSHANRYATYTRTLFVKLVVKGHWRVKSALCIFLSKENYKPNAHKITNIMFQPNKEPK